MIEDIKQTPVIVQKLIDKHFSADGKVQNIQLDINFENLSKIVILASGSSRNAALTAKNFIAGITDIAVVVEFASEFSQISNLSKESDLVIVVSQSGETGDVLSALKLCKQKGIKTFAITNKQNSKIDVMANNSMLVLAGQEMAVPATKTFTAQLLCLYTVGLYIAQSKISQFDKNLSDIIEKLKKLPEILAKTISKKEEIKKAAELLKTASGIVILGRGEYYGLSEETALKIKETSYINATGYPSGEFMHGHLALLDKNYVLISFCLPSFGNEKHSKYIIKNTKEIIEKRKPKLLAISDNFDSADVMIQITQQEPLLQLFESVLIIQILTYETAMLLNNDVYNPRSLTKAVTEE